MSGFPSSPAPFHPVNPWGGRVDMSRAKSLRPMPQRDLRQSMSKPLYRCYVDDERGNPVPVSPAFEKKIAAKHFDIVCRALRAGTITGWRNPRIELVSVPDIVSSQILKV